MSAPDDINAPAQFFLCVLDASGQILQINRQAASALGREPAGLLGLDFVEAVVSPPDRPLVAEALRELAGDAAPEERVFALQGGAGAGGARLAAVFTPLPEKDGAAGAVVCAQLPPLTKALDHGADATDHAAFERFFRGIPAPVALSNIADLSFAYINDAFRTVLGYAPEDILGKTPDELRLFPELTRMGQAAATVLGGGGPVAGIELKIRRKDGELLDALFSADVISNQGQRYFLSVMNDVSARKAAEAALQRKTEELERYFTSSLDPLCIVDAEGRFVRLNPEWEKALGYATTELEGVCLLELVHPDDAPSAAAALGELAAEQRPLSFEQRYRRKDGEYRWIEWRARQQDGVIHAAARDITDRRRAAEALRASEEKHRLVIENSHDIIYSSSLEGSSSSSRRAGPRCSGTRWRRCSASASTPSSTRRTSPGSAPPWRRLARRGPRRTGTPSGCSTRTGPGAGTRRTALLSWTPRAG